ncbi:hypothetical protein TNCV_3663391 [Trichonephila clavipes]|nr:hypothetical protein TNCV_3663391 [Trichonephila clavipes]
MSSFLVLREWDTRNRREGKERNKREERGDGKGEKKESGRERERSPPCMEKGLSPEIGVKKTMNAGGVEDRID